MPRTPAAGTRERILATAGRLFYAHGVRDVSMAQVAEEAGCGKNLLYRHFPSKDDLVAAYLEGFAEGREVTTARVLADHEGDPGGALVALVREVADHVAEPGFQGCAFRNYVREVREYDDAPGRLAQAWLAAGRGRVAGLVARLDVDDPDDVAERVQLVLEGLYASVAYPDRARAAASAVRLVEEIVTA